MRAYLDDLQVRGYKPKTIAGYAKNLHTFVTSATGKGATTLREFMPELAKAYIRYLQHKSKYAGRHYAKRRDDLITASAIRNNVRDLKTFASWLETEHYSATNVLASVRLPMADQAPIEP